MPGPSLARQVVGVKMLGWTSVQEPPLLLALDPDAYMKVFFTPANAAVNVTGRSKVRFVPEDVTLADAILTEH